MIIWATERRPGFGKLGEITAARGGRKRAKLELKRGEKVPLLEENSVPLLGIRKPKN